MDYSDGDVRDKLIQLYGSHVDGLLKTVSSFRKTLIGLLGFVTRLYIGRYEQDLYKYMIPIFSGLDEITKSYIKLIKTVPDDIIEGLIDEFISDTGTLISLIQQIFIVHAVSPHTFLETYGSSMRSLSASSKLVGAYQGMFKYVDRKFPRDLESINHIHHILIIPYRQAQPENRVLFPTSNPMWRISYIQVDYTKMFRRQTVFMLLHECAHVLTDRKRKERFAYFAKARVSSIYCTVLAEYLRQPINTFIRNVSRVNEGKEADIKLFINKVDEDFYSKYLSGKIIEYIEYISDKIANVLQERYKTSKNNELFKYYMDSVDKWMNAELSAENFKIALAIDIGELLTDIYLKFTEDILKHQIREPVNIREAIKLERLCKQKYFIDLLKIYVSDAVEYAMNDPNSKDLLTYLFNDVYSDLFSIMLLGDNDFKPEDYIATIMEFFGMSVQSWTVSDVFLLRIITIAETMGWYSTETRESGSLLDILIKQTDIPPNVADNLAIWWKYCYSKPYRNQVLEYARFCKTELEKQVNGIKGSPEMVAIRGLWEKMGENGEDPEIMPHVYTMWRYLIK
jgi:hypothetical protein